MTATTTKRMTKAAIAKAAAKLADKMLFDDFDITFHELNVHADEMFFNRDDCLSYDGLSDEYFVLRATIVILENTDSKHRAKLNKLYADVDAIQDAHREAGKGWLYLADSAVAHQNLPSGMTDQSVGYLMTLYHCECQVIAVHAENEGLDINALLGYTIY